MRPNIIFSLLCSFFLVSCASKSDIANLQSQIDAITKVQIPSINEQLTSIKGSVTKLEETDTKLKEYIVELQGKAENLKKEDERIDAKIDLVKSQLELADVNNKLEILGKLDDQKQAVDAQILIINNAIAALHNKDTELQTNIDNLKTYTDTALGAQKDWAEATFATLEQYNTLSSTVEEIKIDIQTINTSLSTLETKLANDKTELEGKITNLSTTLQQEISGVTTAYTAAIATAKTEITSAYESLIQSSIAASETSMKSWVSDQLTGYYTIAEINAKISALELLISTGDEGLQDQITALKSDLAAAKTEITTAYQQAIQTAIETNNGIIEGKIASAVNAAVQALETKISAINAEIDSIKSDIANIKTDISNLLSRIQSIVVIPTHSDGSVQIVSGVSDINFVVSPRSASVALAKLGKDVFKVRAVETQTKSSIFTYIPVTAVYDDGETLTVSVDGSKLGSGFFNNEINLNAQLCISDGNNEKTSEFFHLLPGQYYDLSANGTANCYIVNKPGQYKFKATVKGGSTESVGIPANVQVLWETFGTDVAPNVGDLVNGVSLSDGYIKFIASDKKGNAVIAVKDASDNILWSWHIWMTDQPTSHVYNNNAGTMMDRNLGATTATPGDVHALGLLYQWGRKDPFLGSSSINDDSTAASTLSWPSAVSSNSTTGTIAYAVAHPTTFIAQNEITCDWYYTGSTSTDNTRWQSLKAMYDPCPVGWRVPDGWTTGIWSKAFGSSSYFVNGPWDSTNKGMNFGSDNGQSSSHQLGSSATIWYPAPGYRRGGDGSFGNVGINSEYWSCTPQGYYASFLSFNDYGVGPSTSSYRAVGRSVRCCRDENRVITEDLSKNGTANCYVVPAAGDYKFKATVKGGSTESIGTPTSAETLWESFGTDVTPTVGDIVKNVSIEAGYVKFSTPSALNNGNAVIAVKDASGNILWSWHIWVCKDFDPKASAQIYNNNAGTMMDRNLGATSATKSNVGALGLLYQWGRKDPFLSGSDISADTRQAASTIAWPSAVSSNSTNGTIAYAVSNPTTFITYNSSNYDWYYTGSSSTDNTRWQSSKTVYDPCPAGWRVPDGGSSGVWSKAFGSSSSFSSGPWDSTNKGMNFGSGNGKSSSMQLGSASTIWYPAVGYRIYDDGSLGFVGNYGHYWSCTPNVNHACLLSLGIDGDVIPLDYGSRVFGYSVRCLSE